MAAFTLLAFNDTIAAGVLEAGMHVGQTTSPSVRLRCIEPLSVIIHGDDQSAFKAADLKPDFAGIRVFRGVMEGPL